MTFDVAEQFNQSLMKSRVARGEPAEGLSRTLWEASHSPKKSLLLMISVLGPLLGIAVAVQIARKRKAPEILENKAA